MTSIEIEVSGDLERIRERLGNSGLIRRALGDMLDESAHIAENLAETYAPKRTQHLRRSIHSTPARRTGLNTLEASVGVTRTSSAGMVLGTEGDQTAYPFYVHEGTGLFGARGAKIHPRRAKKMRWVGKTGLAFATSTKGQRPQPYIGEAFNDLQHYIPQRADLLVRRILD